MGNLMLFGADLSATTYTSSISENPSFPLANLQDYLPTKLWKASAATDGQYLGMNSPAWFGSSQKNKLILYKHNFDSIVDGLGGHIVIQRANNSAYTSPVTLWDTDLDGSIPDPFVLTFADSPYQFWRILFVSLYGAIPQLGIAMLGRNTDLGTPYGLPYKAFGKRFATIETVALDGTIRKSQALDGRMRLAVNFKLGNALSEAAKNGLYTFFNTVVRGDFRPFFLTDVDGLTHYVYFENSEDPLEVIGYGLNQVASLNFKKVEIG